MGDAKNERTAAILAQHMTGFIDISVPVPSCAPAVFRTRDFLWFAKPLRAEHVKSTNMRWHWTWIGLVMRQRRWETCKLCPEFLGWMSAAHSPTSF